jgi:hypothetical protein
MGLSYGDAKYGNDISQVLSASRARDWLGVYAEIRAHGDFHLSSYVQQKTEVALLTRTSGAVTRRVFIAHTGKP